MWRFLFFCTISTRIDQMCQKQAKIQLCKKTCISYCEQRRVAFSEYFLLLFEQIYVEKKIHLWISCFEINIRIWILFSKQKKAGNDFCIVKILFKSDFSYKWLVTKNKMMYPIDIPHSHWYCTSHVPHFRIFVPHSRPEQMATLGNNAVAWPIYRQLLNEYIKFPNKNNFSVFREIATDMP